VPPNEALADYIHGCGQDPADRTVERTAIWDIVIKKYGRDPLDYDTVRLSHATERFTGAEIEQTFIEALHLAFDEGGEPGELTVGTARPAALFDEREDREAAPMGTGPNTPRKPPRSPSEWGEEARPLSAHAGTKSSPPPGRGGFF
jgi:hypothetical protein